ncbi:MAG: O-antigen ligase family protein [Acidobacteria bacterium]|nr:O-antigen ligase family protein [Acidobacteriota bacterium]
MNSIERNNLSPSTLSPRGTILFWGTALGCALALGAVLIRVLSMPKAWGALACLAICGLCGLIVWTHLKLPIVPALRLALLASFWFRLEINLFAIKKQGHETPVGIVISLMLLLSLLLLVNHLYEGWRGREQGGVFPFSFSAVSVLLAMFCGLSVLQGVETMLGIYGLWGLVSEVLICYVAAAYFTSTTSMRQIVLCFAGAILLNAVLGILQYFDLFGGWELLGSTTGEREMKLPGMEVSRASGLCESPNTFGWILVSLSPLMIAPVLIAKAQFKKWERQFCVAAFFLGIVALILTFSRGSWIAFLCTMPVLVGFVLIAQPAAERGRLIVRLAGALLALVLFSLPFLNPLLARAFGEDDGAAESRLPLMDVAMEMIKANPLLGVGMGSYEAVMRRYDFTADFISDSFPYPVHNLYLHVAAEAGLPALLCLLTLVGIALWRGWQAWRSGPPLPRAIACGAIIGMLAYLITALKEPSSFDSGQIRILFLLCGFLLAAKRAISFPISDPATATTSGEQESGFSGQ